MVKTKYLAVAEKDGEPFSGISYQEEIDSLEKRLSSDPKMSQDSYIVYEVCFRPIVKLQRRKGFDTMEYETPKVEEEIPF